MASDKFASNPLVIRDTGLGVDQKSSRLLKRGLSALDAARSVCLEVVDLIAFESSVFVLSDDWDKTGIGFKDRALKWSCRHLVLYEFKRSGQFIRKLVLPLVKLTDEGYSHVYWRARGTVQIRSDFIHFYEELDRDDFGGTGRRRGTRIDYLFSRTGERKAIWANGVFVNNYRLSSEPIVPMAGGYRRNWATVDKLIHIHGNCDAPYKHTIVFTDVYALARNIALLRGGAENGKNPQIDEGLDTVHAADFPVKFRYVSRGSSVSAWDCVNCDPQAVWFMNNWTGSNTSVWKVEIDHNGPKVSSFTLPDRHGLIRQGILREPRGHFSLTSNYIYSITGDEEIESNDSYFQTLYSWRDNIIVNTSVDKILMEGEILVGRRHVQVLFRIEDGSLKIVKEVNSERFCIAQLLKERNTLANAKVREQEGQGGGLEMKELMRHHPVGGVLRDRAFSDGHLFSTGDNGYHHQDVAAETSADGTKTLVYYPSHDEDHHNTIVVTNVDTETVTWFRPEVPESELGSNMLAQ